MCLRGRVARNEIQKILKRPGFAADWEFAVRRSRITSTASPMPVSSAPMTRAPPGGIFGFAHARSRACAGNVDETRPPDCRRAIFGAQREQPSYRGNFTGHSRLRGQNYCTFSPWVLGEVQKKRGRAFLRARPRFLGKAAKKYCTVKFSPRRERLSVALQIDSIRTLPCTSD